MKATRYIKPYLKNGKGELKKQAISNPPINTGVYFIKQDGKLVYVGYSENHLDKTAYRHFQTWQDRKQKRATYNRERVTVKFIFCSPAKAKILELYFIDKLKPKDNDILYYKHINPALKKRAKELVKTISETDPF